MGVELKRKEEHKQDTNSKIAEMVRVITQIGPDIPEIARKIGAYKETVRYWYKEKLVKRGLVVGAMVNHAKLGLRRMIILADLNPTFEGYAATIFTAMNELCYVLGFEKTTPDNRYLIQASVPYEYETTFADFISQLKELGLFRSVQIMSFDYVRNVPMRAEFYDFDTNQWEFDWSSPPGTRVETINVTTQDAGKFDRIDLHLLKELQIDADRSMTEIQGVLKTKGLDTNYKTLVWHYTTHARAFISGYRVNWMGTRYDPKIDKTMHRKHSYLRLDLLVNNLREDEKLRLVGEINRLPFIWAEAVGANYYVQLAFPTDSLSEAFEYLSNVLLPFRDRAVYFVMDQRNALSFTFSYRLYDFELRKWTFEKDSILNRFQSLILEIKRGQG